MGLSLSCLLFYMLDDQHGPIRSRETTPLPQTDVIFLNLLCFLVTVYWVLSVVRAFQAFILHLGGQAAAEFFADLSQFSSILRHSVLMGLLMTSDFTIVCPHYSMNDMTCHQRLNGDISSLVGLDQNKRLLLSQ
ncbi:hypothetical protein BD779DRAFT_512760 [Infundibulicybe gibba]|nr:hypothetical protein BD779DRAFT_512760 [Infundibulicybe gibba]